MVPISTMVFPRSSIFEPGSIRGFRTVRKTEGAVSSSPVYNPRNSHVSNPGRQLIAKSFANSMFMSMYHVKSDLLNGKAIKLYFGDGG